MPDRVNMYYNHHHHYGYYYLFALLRQETKCLTLDTDLPVTEDYILFAPNISDVKYPRKHSGHRGEWFSLAFSLSANTPDSAQLLHPLGGKFKNVYVGFQPCTCFGNKHGEC